MTRLFKRPFQPSITSYFSHHAHDEESPNQATHPTYTPLSHQLPTHIQSSLLNVGMRIRKSVPEGYKNAQSKTHQPLTKLSPQRKSPQGLVPYCGILKTGDYRWSSLPAVEDVPPLDFDDEGADSLPSSQESVATSAGLDDPTSAMIDAANERKRHWEDEDSEEAEPVDRQAFGSDAILDMGLVGDVGMLRPKARPRTRRKPLGEVTCNRGVVRELDMVDADDFGDAPFLKPRNGLG